MELLEKLPDVIAKGDEAALVFATRTTLLPGGTMPGAAAA